LDFPEDSFDGGKVLKLWVAAQKVVETCLGGIECLSPGQWLYLKDDQVYNSPEFMEDQRVSLCIAVLLNLVNGIFEFLGVTHLGEQERDEKEVEVVLHAGIDISRPVIQLYK
jgi:hypothetical protein